MMKIKFYSGNSALHDNRATASLNPPQFSVLSFSAGWICFSQRFWDAAKFHRQSFSGAILHLTNRASAGSLTLARGIPPTDLKEWVTQKLQPFIKQCSFFHLNREYRPQMPSRGRSSLRSYISLFGKLPTLLSWHTAVSAGPRLLTLLSLPPETSQGSSFRIPDQDISCNLQPWNKLFVQIRNSGFL